MSSESFKSQIMDNMITLSITIIPPMLDHVDKNSFF